MAQIIDGANALKLREVAGMSIKDGPMGRLRETMKEDIRREIIEFHEIKRFHEIDDIKKSLDNMETKIRNLAKLYKYSQLEDDWDSEGAKPFPTELIYLTWGKILDLEIQPEVFQTMRESIQFEYEKDNGDYLEFEIYKDRIDVFEIINGNEDECKLDVSYDLNEIVNVFQINNNESVYYFYRGNRYYNLHQYEKAVENYTKAIELAPYYDWAYNNRGASYKNLRQYEKAIEDFKKAIELDDNKLFRDILEECEKERQVNL